MKADIVQACKPANFGFVAPFAVFCANGQGGLGQLHRSSGQYRREFSDHRLEIIIFSRSEAAHPISIVNYK